jgi:hypothetical protein
MIPRLLMDVVDLGLRKHDDDLHRHATTTCASLLEADIFINSQSLVGDCASLDLESVKARRFFQRLPRRRRWRLVAANFMNVETFVMVLSFSIL